MRTEAEGEGPLHVFRKLNPESVWSAGGGFRSSSLLPVSLEFDPPAGDAVSLELRHGRDGFRGR